MAERKLSDVEIYVLAVIATISSTETSSLLSLLHNKYPLQHFGLGHLKRARKLQDGFTDILLGPQTYSDNILKELGSRITAHRVIPVTRVIPETEQERTEWCHSWPSNYRPGVAARRAAESLSDADLSKHLELLSRAEVDACNYPIDFREGQGAIIVNPLTGKVCSHCIVYCGRCENSQLRR